MYTMINFDVKKGFIYFYVICMNIFAVCMSSVGRGQRPLDLRDPEL